jgi:hypothetical protein
MMPWKLLQERRADFASRRAAENQGLDDSQFLGQIAFDNDLTDRRIAVVLRKLVARECGIDPGLLRPDDLTSDLEEIMGAPGFVGWLFGGRYGFEFHSVFYGLEGGLSETFGRRVLLKEKSVVKLRMFARDEKWAPDPKQTLGDWIALAAREIRELIGEMPAGAGGSTVTGGVS